MECRRLHDVEQEEQGCSTDEVQQEREQRVFVSLEVLL
jgi:hypothetical protein